MKRESLVPIDFEFHSSNELHPTLVCCSLIYRGKLEEYWLFEDQEAQELLEDRLNQLINEEVVFVAHAAVAEGRCFLALGLENTEPNFFDTFTEYRVLTNHNFDFLLGPQLQDGKITFIREPPPRKQVEFQAKHSLEEMTYKILKKRIDSKRKEEMRDIIISKDAEKIIAYREEIIEYCSSDIENLVDVAEFMFKYYKENLPTIFEFEHILVRGRYSWATAKMESLGYPVNVDQMRAFSINVGPILSRCQRDINSQFKDSPPFRFEKKTGLYKWNQKGTRETLKKLYPGYMDTWQMTDKFLESDGESGDISLALEAFEKFFSYRHDYPRGEFGAQMVRYLKLKQSLNGFSPTAKKSIWDSLGSDGRVRPFMNIFKAQSTRSQPTATNFLFLKAAWMRVLCQPVKGKAIAGIDYGSQEYLLSAIVSYCKTMYEAYVTGDVYLAFAKQSGMAPEEATKKSHERERDLCKALVLGISYLMSKFGLAIQLSQKTGEEWTEDMAQELLNTFFEINYELKQFQDGLKASYLEGNFPVVLPCGAVMWGNNPNLRSVCNVPSQGSAASIMRRAVLLAQKRGLNIIFTLHDALYIEYDAGDFSAIDTLYDCMFEAFHHYFEDDTKEWAKAIRMDIKTWGPDYKKYNGLKEKLLTPKGREIGEISEIHIDKRAKEEYEYFSQFLKLEDL
jgi:DNA polymerase I